MYCQLLENAARQLKNQRLKTPLEVHADLPWPAFLPHDYISGQRQRIEVYRRLARLRKFDRLAEFRDELVDRYGPLPEAAEWLLRLAEVRLLAARWQVAVIRLEKVSGEFGMTDLVLEYKSARLAKRLAERSGGRLRVVDRASAFCRLAPAEEEPQNLFPLLRQLLRPDAAADGETRENDILSAAS